MADEKPAPSVEEILSNRLQERESLRDALHAAGVVDHELLTDAVARLEGEKRVIRLPGADLQFQLSADLLFPLRRGVKEWLEENPQRANLYRGAGGGTPNRAGTAQGSAPTPAPTPAPTTDTPSPEERRRRAEERHREAALRLAKVAGMRVSPYWAGR